MNTPKRVFISFLRIQTIKTKSLFEREVIVLFHKFVKWYQDNNYQKSPAGVTVQVFKKWLKKEGHIVIKKKRV